MLANITPREKQILSLIAAGSKIEQIAAKMDMDEDSIRHNMRIVLTKIIANEQTRNIIEAAQRSIPTLIRTGKGNGKAHDYITRAEFNDFRDNLMERMKSFIGELSPEIKSKK
jgi:DNA-binding CsgD family transcriptional regulator